MTDTSHHVDRRVPHGLVVLAWLWPVIPAAYGLYQLMTKVPALFGH
jgi:hypothetical protein